MYYLYFKARRSLRRYFIGLEGQNGIKKRQKGISIRPEVFCKKGVLKKEALVQVFSCEFYKTFKNICSYRTPSVAAL